MHDSSLIVRPEDVRVVAHPSPFSVRHVRAALPQGASIADMLAAVGIAPEPQHTHVWLDGEEVPADWWARVRPRGGHVLELQGGVPADLGASELRGILSIVTSYAGALIGGTLIGGWQGQVASALISIGGMFLWNALIPLPPVPAEPVNANLLGASNPYAPYAVVPYTVGRMRLTPNLAARTYTTVEGDQQYMHALFVFAKGWAQVSSIKIGQTAIEQFSAIQWQVFNSDDLATSIFRNNVHELAVGAVAGAWQTVTRSGGAATIDIGEAVEGLDPGAQVRVWDTLGGDDGDGAVVDPSDYVLAYATGILTYNVGTWPAGTDRYEIRYWPAGRAVTRVLPATSEEINVEIDFLSGLYGLEKETQDLVEASLPPSVANMGPIRQALAILIDGPVTPIATFDVRYRIDGTAEASRVNVLAFQQLSESEYLWGDNPILLLAHQPIDEVVYLIDMTSDEYGGTKRVLLPSEYVVNELTGSITRADAQDWGFPPWQYVQYTKEQHLPIDFTAPNPLFSMKMMHAPIEDGSDVVLEMYQLITPIPFPVYGWVEIDASKYTVDYENGRLTWNGLIPWMDFLDIPAYELGCLYVPYRVTYRASTGLRGTYRWAVKYRWDPLAEICADWASGTAMAHIEDALTYLQTLVTNIKLIGAGSREATAIYKAQMADILTRLMEYVPQLDPSGADPTLQALIDDIVDLNGNSGGLGELRLLVAAYGVCAEPEDSAITDYNDFAWHICAVFDALIEIYVWFEFRAIYPLTAWEPIYSPMTRFLHLQNKLAPAFGAALYSETEFNFRDTTRALIRRTIQWPTMPAIYEASVRRLPGPDTADGYPWIPPEDDDDYEWESEATVSYMRALGEELAVNEPDCTLLALRINATERLTGVVDDVSGIVEQWIPVWNSVSEEWEIGLTRNPAWHFCWVLLGSSNARPIQGGYKTDWTPPDLSGYPVLDGAAWEPSRLDMDAITAWADWCDAKPWSVDYSFTAETTVLQALKLIASAGRASFQFADGRYSVVMDRDQTADGPVQLFSPRNVKDLEVSVALVAKPDALKVQFQDEAADYQENEVVVCRDGYNQTGDPELVIEALDGGGVYLAPIWGPMEDAGLDSIIDLTTMLPVDPGDYTVDYPNSRIEYTVGPTWPAGSERFRVTYYATRLAATTFEEVDLPGCSGMTQAWQHGRYMRAVAQARPRKITWQSDWEYLRCSRGDLVRVQHYALLVGLHSGARVTAVEVDVPPPDIIGCTVDDFWQMEAGHSYGIQARYRDGYVAVIPVVLDVGDTIETLTFVDPAPVSPGGEILRVGDMVVFGEVGAEAIDVLVTEIRPVNNLGARLTGVDAAPEVLQSEEWPIPDFDPGITEPPGIILYAPNPPAIAGLVSDERVMSKAGDRLIRNIQVNLAPVDNTGSYETPAWIRLEWRRTSSNDTGEWTREPDAVVDARQVMIYDVVQSGRYDIRVRYMSARFRLSDWTYELDYQVIGTDTLPPAVQNFRIDNRTLRWDYSGPPIDLAGFHIKTLEGVGIEDPDNQYFAGTRRFAILGPDARELPFTASFRPWISGQVTFLIRAFDAVGNYSALSAILEWDSADPTPLNIILEQDERNDGWTGDILEGEVSGLNLVAVEDPGDLFWTDDANPFWVDDSLPFWIMLWGGLEYEFEVVVARDGTLMWMQHTMSAQPAQTHVRHYLTDPDGIEELLLGKAEVRTGTWTVRTVLEPDGGVVPPEGYGVQAIMIGLKAFVDVPDLEERLTGIEITVAASGVRLPITVEFATIVSVALTLRDGSAATQLYVADKDVDDGPLIMGRDSAGDPATATFDAFVRGY